MHHFPPRWTHREPLRIAPSLSAADARTAEVATECGALDEQKTMFRATLVPGMRRTREGMLLLRLPRPNLGATVSTTVSTL